MVGTLLLTVKWPSLFLHVVVVVVVASLICLVKVWLHN